MTALYNSVWNISGLSVNTLYITVLSKRPILTFSTSPDWYLSRSCLQIVIHTYTYTCTKTNALSRPPDVLVDYNRSTVRGAISYVPTWYFRSDPRVFRRPPGVLFSPQISDPCGSSTIESFIVKEPKESKELPTTIHERRVRVEGISLRLVFYRYSIRSIFLPLLLNNPIPDQTGEKKRLMRWGQPFQFRKKCPALVIPRSLSPKASMRLRIKRKKASASRINEYHVALPCTGTYVTREEENQPSGMDGFPSWFSPEQGACLQGNKRRWWGLWKYFVDSRCFPQIGATLSLSPS